MFSMLSDGTPSTGQMPLGYLKDLVRPTQAQPDGALPPDALIHLGFISPKNAEKNGATPPILAKLFIQRGPHDKPERWHGWQTVVPADSPLSRMMAQIQADLLTPDPSFCEQLNRRYPFSTNSVFNLPARLLGWTA
jgi:hypothetical protein